jgi:hypothetical protein
MQRGAMMTITTPSSRQFNQDASKTKETALAGQRQYSKIADLLAMPGTEEVELIIAPMQELARAAKLI